MTRVLRQQRHTLLIVYEGYAEGCLLKHVGSVYLSRNCGMAVTTRNARGGGGRHVLDHAVRVWRRTAYDQVALLMDTDQDWDDAQRQRAASQGIQVLESAPCLEAWLLTVNRHPVPGNGAQIKREFETRYGGQAHDADVYPRHFPKNVLDEARTRVVVLDQLLRLLRR